MKRTHWIRTLLLIAAAGLLAGCGAQGNAQNDGAIQDLQSQLADLGSRVQQLADQVETLQSQQSGGSDGDLAQQIEQLRSQINAIESGGGSASGGGTAPMKIGFVSAEEVFVSFRGTETAIAQYREEKQAKEQELQSLQDKWSAGTISQNEYATQRDQVQQELQVLDQQLTNEITQKIVEAVEVIGSEQGYDLITARKNVVLYYEEGSNIVNITDQVLERMNQEFSSSSGDGENGS